MRLRGVKPGIGCGVRGGAPLYRDEFAESWEGVLPFW